MHVAAQPRAARRRLAPRHQQQLGVRLQADDAVDHLRTDRLETLGPVDVGLLVEARLQLHDRHHLLAAPRRLDQQVHQHRLLAGAIDGLLDGQDVGIQHGLAQELHDRLEALERMVQQHVVLAQSLEHRADARQPAQRPRRLVGLEAQQRPMRRVGGLVDQLVQAHEVDGPVDAMQRRLRQVELRQQQPPQRLGAGVDDLEPDRAAVVPRRQAAAQRLAQVAHVVLVDFEVGVARDAELRERLDDPPGEELGQVRPDHAGQEHEVLLALRAAVLRQLDHARQHARHLDDGDRVLAAERVAAAELHDEVERLVGHLRERMRRIESDGHQQRSHLAFEEARHPFALGLGALGMVDDPDAMQRQRRHHLLVEDRVLLVDQRVRLDGDQREFPQRVSGARHPRRLERVGEAHLEEFVEVGRHDRDVAQPLQQRHVGAQGLGEHAPVEFEDRTLAIEKGNPQGGGRRNDVGHRLSL